MNTTCQTIRHALQGTPTEATYKFLGENGLPFYYCDACVSYYGFLDNSDLTLQTWGDGLVILAERERKRAECMDAHPAGKARQTPQREDMAIITSETGGQKQDKLARFDLMPTDALWALAEHYGRGEQKYPTENGVPNYRKGYPLHLSYAAMMRHANLFWGGEDIDPESGSHHLAAVAWHALCMMQNLHDFGDRFDDRFQQTPYTND